MVRAMMDSCLSTISSHILSSKISIIGPNWSLDFIKFHY